MVVGGDYVDTAGVGKTISWTVNPYPVKVMKMIEIAAVEGMDSS